MRRNNFSKIVSILLHNTNTHADFVLVYVLFCFKHRPALLWSTWPGTWWVNECNSCR